MNEKQMQVIIGLIAGMQMATVHLANVIADKNGISHEDLATSFEKTAELTPEATNNRELIQLVLTQVGRGIRSSSTGGEYEALISRLLH